VQLTYSENSKLVFQLLGGSWDVVLAAMLLFCGRMLLDVGLVWHAKDFRAQ
jgi:hypothetical protein